MTTKLLLIVAALLVCGCADYSTNATINGLHSPNDLVPQPFPDTTPAEHQEIPKPASL